MQFAKGQRVRFLNDVGEAEVLAVDGNRVNVLRSDGFEEWYPSEELIVVEDDVLSQHLERQTIRPKDQEVIRVSRSETFTPKLSTMEVDLHIHNLVENERLISKEKILDVQLFHARQAIDNARKKNIRRVVLIHGIGQGVLRKALMKLLDGYDRLQYFDASYQKYGHGATEVELW
ncbi:MAG: Smr/MutS family protein [Cryomorphaceae bacterium]|nr:Smr/MutS family protein [Cryomorphaceae bacterium]